jgi:hypothetical protein
MALFITNKDGTVPTYPLIIKSRNVKNCLGGCARL